MQDDNKGMGMEQRKKNTTVMAVGTFALISAALGLVGCNKSGGQGIAGLRIEPTYESLEKVLGDSDGRMLPLYVGEERRLLSVFVEDGRLYHCMAQKNVVVDKATCKGDQPFSGVSTKLGRLDGLGAPCLGGIARDMINSQMMLAICASPRPGINESRGVEKGQLIYVVQSPSGGQVFTFEPVRRSIAAAKSAAPALVTGAVTVPAVADATSPTGESGSALATSVPQGVNEADEEAVDAADSAADAAEISADATVPAAVGGDEMDEARRMAEERVRHAEEGERRGIDKVRHDAATARRSSHPSSGDANPIVRQLPEDVVSVSSVDAKYSERVSEECPWGALGEPCHQKVREELCAGKWSPNPQPGQSECKR